MSPQTDPRVDAYIAKSAAFARPILTHLRALVHRGCPGAGETIKWGMPFFTRGDTILCMMAAFKAHCAFGFWHKDMKTLVAGGATKADEAMGILGRITSLKDLPGDQVMLGYIRQAAKLSESSVPARPVTKGKPKPLAVPADLAAALKKNRQAAAVFKEFSPSKRKDYIEWITEAKRAETRAKRLATAIGWIAEGKARNWKYEKS
ncbi:MAG: YdeI/OmpD-associated family protein [Verrucomicrobia bacterium]|nr:YdeI/OmpD-associated family protein [Verrucomicrobiota bacterium]